MGFPGTTLAIIGLLVFLIGVALTIIGIITIIARRGPKKERERESENENSNGTIQGGGVIIICPIPIIFGTDKRFLLLAFVAAIALMIVYLFILLFS